MPYTNHTQTLLFPCRRNINFCLIRTLNRQKLHFIPKQRNGGHLDLTNQSSGNYTELYQLSVRANECGCVFVIDCSLARDRDQNVRVRISSRLIFKNDPPFKVCNKLLLRKVNHCFSSANPFGCWNLEINIQRKEQRKERLAKICPFNEASINASTTVFDFNLAQKNWVHRLHVEFAGASEHVSIAFFFTNN